MKNPRSVSIDDKLAPTNWLTARRFATVLALLILALFPGLLFPGKTFVFRDFGIFTYPNAGYLHDCFWRGELPLWNSYCCCGIPFLAQWNMAALYPLSLFYLLLPVGIGLNLFFYAHLFLAGMGMYFLARRWTGNCFAAAIAGVAFTFNGMSLNCLMWTSNAAGLAWMPWVVWAVEDAWLLGGKKVVVAALIGTAQMLTGAAEIILFTWLIILGLLGLNLIHGWRRLGQSACRVLAVVALVTLLSLAQLLPFGDLLLHSSRSSDYSTDLWSAPLSGWANLFLPLYHCYQTRLGVFFQHGQDWTSSYYLGAGTITLAFLAFPLAATSRKWVLGGTALLGFWLALGNQGVIYEVLRNGLPLVGMMQFPIKFVIFTVFTVPLLAALAVAAVLAGSDQDSMGVAKTVRTVVAGMVVTMSIIIGLLWHSHRHPFPYEQWQVLLTNGLMRGVFFLLFMGGVLLCRIIAKLQSQVVLQLSAVILVWADLATHVPSQNPMVDASVYKPNLLKQELNIAPRLGETRAMLLKSAGDFISWNELGSAEMDYLSYRRALIGDCNLLDGIPLADGFYAVFIRDQRNLFEQFYLTSTNSIQAQGFADFLAVGHVSGLDGNLSWQARNSHLPFYSVGAKPEYVERDKTVKFLLDPGFNPKATVYLPPEASRLGITQPAQATVRSCYFHPQRQEFDVDSDAPTFLVLSQSYYHNWKAHVNGQPAKILRANYAFQAIPVPKGKSRVRLAYEDPLFQWGAVVSLLALLGCSIFLFTKPSNNPMEPQKRA